VALGAAALILGGIVLVVGGAKKKRRATNGVRRLPAEPPQPPEEEPVIQWEMTPSDVEGAPAFVEWFMPEGWLERYATPRVREYVLPRHEAGDEIDPLDVSLYIIQGQTNAFPLPAAPRPPTGDMWQVDVPTTEDYYEGPEPVLGLLYHVNEYVEDALGRWQAGDNLYLADVGWPDEPYEGGG
jgi:hypothetical protein